MPKKKHRKPPEARKDIFVRIRVTADQHARLMEAATRAEKDLSEWARDHLFRHAKEEAAAAAKEAREAAKTQEAAPQAERP